MPKLTRLLALVSLLAVGLLAGCGSDDKSGDGSSGAKSEDPVALLKKAFATQVDSGEIEMEGRADFKGSGKVSGPVSFSLEGPFEMRGKSTLPLVDWDIEVSGPGQDLSGGIVATEDNAFVKFRGQTYEVGSQLYKQFLSRQQQQAKQGPQSLEDLGFDPADWLQDPKVSGGPSIGGSATRRVSGQIDVKKMVGDLLDAARSPAVRKQFGARGQSVPEVSDADVQKITDAVERAQLTVDVDDEDVARKVAFTAAFDVPEGTDADGVTGGELEFSYALPKVGGAVDITAPADAKPLALLLQQLGLGSNLPGGGLRPSRGRLRRPTARRGPAPAS